MTCKGSSNACRARRFSALANLHLTCTKVSQSHGWTPIGANFPELDQRISDLANDIGHDILSERTGQLRDSNDSINMRY